MKSRTSVLGVCLLVIAAAALLAPSLQNLRFAPARPISAAPGAARFPILTDLRVSDDTSVWEILFFWLAVVLPTLLIILLLPPELRKRALRMVVRFASFVLVMVLALRYHLINLPVIESGEIAAGQGSFLTQAGATETGTFTPPMLPPWVTYLVSLIVVMLVALAIYWVYLAWRGGQSRRSGGLAAVAGVARRSLDDLAEGRQWGDVIIEAYARMTDVLRTTRDLRRQDSWTPREFAVSLARKGLPSSAVDELTQLFEAARYGGSVADETARRRAASCLESILSACRVAP